MVYFAMDETTSNLRSTLISPYQSWKLTSIQKDHIPGMFLDSEIRKTDVQTFDINWYQNPN